MFQDFPRVIVSRGATVRAYHIFLLFDWAVPATQKLSSNYVPNLALRLRYRRGCLRYAQYAPKLARNLVRQLHKRGIVVSDSEETER
jgi:hypothetical protein